mmetsp:Transcript_59172/g.68474  ORF Transcript_59172/g.68474 Transcript_59172/m.68474 type:complete len:241 (-) Transcript_59172:190-912(-)
MFVLFILSTVAVAIWMHPVTLTVLFCPVVLASVGCPRRKLERFHIKGFGLSAKFTWGNLTYGHEELTNFAGTVNLLRWSSFYFIFQLAIAPLLNSHHAIIVEIKSGAMLLILVVTSAVKGVVFLGKVVHTLSRHFTHVPIADVSFTAVPKYVNTATMLLVVSVLSLIHLAFWMAPVSAPVALRSKERTIVHRTRLEGVCFVLQSCSCGGSLLRRCHFLRELKSLFLFFEPFSSLLVSFSR